ncbi:MAG: hypothetical protein CMP20_09205 [Rickettsiales bacterium]|nr:hypothetical protein [Rickettsiales bacterium]
MFPVRPENQWLKDAIDRGDEYLQKDLETLEQDRYSVSTNMKTSIQTKRYHVTGHIEAIKRGDVDIFQTMKQDERYRTDTNHALITAIIAEQTEIIGLILCDSEENEKFDVAFEYVSFECRRLYGKEDQPSVDTRVEKFLRMLELPFGNQVQNYANVVYEAMNCGDEEIALALLCQNPLPHFLVEQKLLSSWTFPPPKILGFDEQKLLERACVCKCLAIVRYLIEDMNVDPAANNNNALKKTLETILPHRTIKPYHVPEQVDKSIRETLEYLLSNAIVFELFSKDKDLKRFVRQCFACELTRDIFATFFPQVYAECLMTFEVFLLSDFGLFESWVAVFDKDPVEFTKELLRSCDLTSFAKDKNRFFTDLYNYGGFFTFELDYEVAKPIIGIAEYCKLAVMLLRDGYVRFPVERVARQTKLKLQYRWKLARRFKLFDYIQYDKTYYGFLKACAEIHLLRPGSQKTTCQVFMVDELIAAATACDPRHNFVWGLFMDCYYDSPKFSLGDVNLYLKGVSFVLADNLIRYPTPIHCESICRVCQLLNVELERHERELKRKRKRKKSKTKEIT